MIFYLTFIPHTAHYRTSTNAIFHISLSVPCLCIPKLRLTQTDIYKLQWVNSKSLIANLHKVKPHFKGPGKLKLHNFL